MLAQTGSNRREAAELLGIGERTLSDKLKKYAVESRRQNRATSNEQRAMPAR